MHITEQIIIDKLTKALNPNFLEVIDESYLHANHNNEAKKGGTHYKIKITSDMLKSFSRIEAHRLINKILIDELANGIHALSIDII